MSKRLLVAAVAVLLVLVAFAATSCARSWHPVDNETVVANVTSRIPFAGYEVTGNIPAGAIVVDGQGQMVKQGYNKLAYPVTSIKVTATWPDERPAPKMEGVKITPAT